MTDRQVLEKQTVITSTIKAPKGLGCMWIRGINIYTAQSYLRLMR